MWHYDDVTLLLPVSVIVCTSHEYSHQPNTHSDYEVNIKRYRLNEVKLLADLVTSSLDTFTIRDCYTPVDLKFVSTDSALVL